MKSHYLELMRFSTWVAVVNPRLHEVIALNPHIWQSLSHNWKHFQCALKQVSPGCDGTCRGSAFRVVVSLQPSMTISHNDGYFWKLTSCAGLGFTGSKQSLRWFLLERDWSELFIKIGGCVHGICSHSHTLSHLVTNSRLLWICSGKRSNDCMDKGHWRDAERVNNSSQASLEVSLREELYELSGCSCIVVRLAFSEYEVHLFNLVLFIMSKLSKLNFLAGCSHYFVKGVWNIEVCFHSPFKRVE